MRKSTALLLAALAPGPGVAGPYSAALDDPWNPHDAPVPGFVGPHGDGKARLDDGFGEIENPDNRVNPLFFAWATVVSDYLRADGQAGFADPGYALGPVTGDHFDVVSLGDLDASAIADGDPPGRITIEFTQPIRDRSGADFVVFENGFIDTHGIGGAGIGGIFAELAHVEVSTDGVTFQRFPATSLTESTVGGYGTIDPSQVHHLAGKHANGQGESWGTPFDLAALGIDGVTHLRLVDVPGDGSFPDADGRPIYDAWRTFGSGGFDLEAVGAIAVDMNYAAWPALAELTAGQRGGDDDPDGDGIPNLLEYAFGLTPWWADPPASGWSFELLADEGTRFLELVTRRDERLIDLTREIQVSADLEQWETVAVSSAGAAFQGSNGHAPGIREESAGEQAGIGVIRRDRLSFPLDPSQPRYFRLRITRHEP